MIPNTKETQSLFPEINAELESRGLRWELHDGNWHLETFYEGYWERRKHLAYYRKAVEFANTYSTWTDGGSVLDVGGGIGLGCQYLLDVNADRKVSIELPSKGLTLDGVEVIEGEFTEIPIQRFDCALCLQVLEHQDRPRSFCDRLFQCAPCVVISVPHDWPASQDPDHVQHGITEATLEKWAGRIPTELVDTGPRLVAIYKNP